MLDALDFASVAAISRHLLRAAQSFFCTAWMNKAVDGNIPEHLRTHTSEQPPTQGDGCVMRNAKWLCSPPSSHTEKRPISRKSPRTTNRIVGALNEKEHGFSGLATHGQETRDETPRGGQTKKRWIPNEEPSGVLCTAQPSGL